MTFNKKIKNKIKKHALEDFPNECCGLIIDKDGEPSVYKCENHSKDKRNFFRIGVKEYLAASEEGDILACYHSHTEEDHCSGFSGFDKKIGNSHDLNLVMYSVREDSFKEYTPYG